MSSLFSFSSRWAGTVAALALMMLAAPAAASANAYNDAIKADGPIAYYELNGDATDSSGNGHDGTATNATFGPDRPFDLAVSSVSFNGNGNIAVSSLAAQAQTVELWVKPTVKTSMDLVTHGDPSADGWSVAIGAKRKLVFKTGGRTISSRFPIITGRWSMIDVAWTSSSVSFAVNGGVTQFKGKPLSAAPGPGSAADLTIANGVKGSVDEVALYPTALTRTQMGNHYTATGLPINTATPVVSGVPRVGFTLHVTQGTWQRADLGITDQWQQCDPTTGDCSDIGGATGADFTLTSGQIGKQIQVVETGTNSIGSTSVTSNQTATVVDVAPIGGPVNVTPPSIAGSPVEGQTLSADPGTWNPSTGLTFAYQWQRCDIDGGNCSPVGGATSQTYLLGSSDVGSTVDVVVTANDGSHTSDPAESDATAVVTAPQSGGGNPGGGTGAGTGGGTATTASGGVQGVQVACPARLASVPKRLSKRQRGFGKVVLRFSRGSGNTALKAVLALRSKNVRSVEFRLGAKRVKRLRHSPFRAAINRSRLKPGSIQTLKVIVTPKHGRKFSLKVRIRTAACS